MGVSFSSTKYNMVYLVLCSHIVSFQPYTVSCYILIIVNNYGGGVFAV